MEDYGNMSPEQMSVLLFRSLGMFGAKGKCFLISLLTLLFGFFLIIPSTIWTFPCVQVCDLTVSWWDSLLVPASRRFGVLGLGRRIYSALDP